MVYSWNGMTPRLGEGCYVAPDAVVLGNVELGERSSVWFKTVIRGDVHSIRIGAKTNIQDSCTLHVTGGTHPLTIGDEVSIGHGAIVHGAKLADRVLVGMRATVLDGAVIGEESIVGAGAVVPEGAIFPPRSIIMGIPGKRVREATDEHVGRILEGRDNYLALARIYLEKGIRQV